MRLTLSQENGQYGRKILQMNHRSYNEMRGSTAVQYCRSILPVAVWGNTLAVRVVLPLWPYCRAVLPCPGWLLLWSLVSFYEITVL
jgi:hypothetical protein